MAKYLRRKGAKAHEIFLFTDGLAARGDMEEVPEAEALAILKPAEVEAVVSDLVAPVKEALALATAYDKEPEAKAEVVIKPAEIVVAEPVKHTIKSFGFGHWRVMQGEQEISDNLPKADAQALATALNNK